MNSRYLFSIGMAALACILSNRDCSGVTEPPTYIISNSTQNTQHMKMNAGIITPHLAATRKFYTEIMGFGIVYESEWFLLLSSPDGSQHLSFLQPQHQSQQPLFQTAFAGKGVYLTVEVDDVDLEYDRIRQSGAPIAIELRDEPWGDRHFAIVDPNGIGIDIVKYTAPAT